MTPTVETSVAVAIPLMTKKRMANAKVRPGTAIAKVRAINATGARAPAPTSELRERHHATKTSASAATNAGKAAGKQGRDRQPRYHRADRDQHQPRRDGLRHRARRRQQRRELARMHASLLHLGKEDRRHRRHVGGLRAGDA